MAQARGPPAASQAARAPYVVNSYGAPEVWFVASGPRIISDLRALPTIAKSCAKLLVFTAKWVWTILVNNVLQRGFAGVRPVVADPSTQAAVSLVRMPVLGQSR